MDLSIIIPVFNEIHTLPECLRRVEAVNLEREILIVDDGSTDGTRQYLESLPPAEHRSVFFHERNRGKGAAIQTALPHARGDFVVIQDGDLEYDPEDLKALLAAAKNGTPIVYGSRVLGGDPISYLSFYLGGRFLSWLTNRLYGSHITDEPTCYKLFRRDILQEMNLTARGFSFCPEVTALALRKGYSIHEIPISYLPRSKKEGKKISWRTGVGAIYTLLKYRWKRKVS
ncbi:MAG: glycosyltransferase family 2 protein [Candidatus Neomarinimicrobiota bacterium]|nr:MAG: glycosyltransferase family 2 protein [Candidatus Neomarinimicrobiota bacterium]